MTTLVSMGPVWTTLAPLAINYVVSPLVCVGVGYLALLLKRKWGLDISAQAQASFEQAAVNAAGRIAASQDKTFANMKVNVGSPLVAAEVPVVLAAVPKVLAKAVTPADVEDLILAKVGHVQAAMKA